MGPGLRPEPRAVDHEILPVPGTAYSVGGTNAGHRANIRNGAHYPVEAVCSCGEVIRCEHWVAIGPDGQWRHTGRMPGDPR